ncbi:MAG: hypothetical protein NTW87_32335 [Planctomycetota bacterium]|nr:hypothetical protein [Planctomycetota bacterium]
MKPIFTLCVVVALSCGAGLCGEPGEEGGKKGPPPGMNKEKLKEALGRKLSFEFVGTPLEEVVQFLAQATQANLVLDPRIGERRRMPITLKAQDMPLEQALAGIAKMAELKWQPREDGIYLADPKNFKGGEGGFDEGAGKGKSPAMPKLSMKLPDGTVIEADAPVLMMVPGMTQQLLERAVDEGKDGLLAYRLDRDVPANVDMPRLKALLAQVAPHVKAEIDNELKVLVLTSEQPVELRRAAALMRAFRPEPQQRPPFGPPPDEDGFRVRKKPPLGPDGKPMFGPEGKPPLGPEGKGAKNPGEPPGQF